MILDKLNDTINGENNSLRDFCLHVKENIEEIGHINISQLAELCFMSKGQVSKCVRQLGYADFAEFKKECVEYMESLTRKKPIFDPRKDLGANIDSTTKEYTQCLWFTINKMDLGILNALCREIRLCRRLYVYGHGDTRGNCYDIQRELKYQGISVMILDEKLSEDPLFQAGDLLVVLSTNGQLFHFEKRRVRKLKAMPVRKWLVTCDPSLDFSEHQFCVPVKNRTYNEYILSYVINLLIMTLQITP